MIISTDTEKPCGKIQYPFMIKILRYIRIEGTFLNIALNCEILTAFPLRSVIR